MDNRTKERKPPDKGRVKMKPPDGLKAMPKELAVGALQDGTQRIMSQLRDAGQREERSDYGGERIENAAADGARLAARSVEAFLKSGAAVLNRNRGEEPPPDDSPFDESAPQETTPEAEAAPVAEELPSEERPTLPEHAESRMLPEHSAPELPSAEKAALPEHPVSPETVMQTDTPITEEPPAEAGERASKRRSRREEESASTERTEEEWRPAYKDAEPDAIRKPVAVIVRKPGGAAEESTRNPGGRGVPSARKPDRAVKTLAGNDAPPLLKGQGVRETAALPPPAGQPAAEYGRRKLIRERGRELAAKQSDVPLLEANAPTEPLPLPESGVEYQFPQMSESPVTRTGKPNPSLRDALPEPTAANDSGVTLKPKETPLFDGQANADRELVKERESLPSAPRSGSASTSGNASSVTPNGVVTETESAPKVPQTGRVGVKTREASGYRAASSSADAAPTAAVQGKQKAVRERAERISERRTGAISAKQESVSANPETSVQPSEQSAVPVKIKSAYAQNETPSAEPEAQSATQGKNKLVRERMEQVAERRIDTAAGRESAASANTSAPISEQDAVTVKTKETRIPQEPTSSSGAVQGKRKLIRERAEQVTERPLDAASAGKESAASADTPAPISDRDAVPVKTKETGVPQEAASPSGAAQGKRELIRERTEQVAERRIDTAAGRKSAASADTSAPIPERDAFTVKTKETGIPQEATSPNGAAQGKRKLIRERTEQVAGRRIDAGAEQSPAVKVKTSAVMPEKPVPVKTKDMESGAAKPQNVAPGKPKAVREQTERVAEKPVDAVSVKREPILEASAPTPERSPVKTKEAYALRETPNVIPEARTAVKERTAQIAERPAPLDSAKPEISEPPQTPVKTKEALIQGGGKPEPDMEAPLHHAVPEAEAVRTERMPIKTKEAYAQQEASLPQSTAPEHEQTFQERGAETAAKRTDAGTIPPQIKGTDIPPKPEAMSVKTKEAYAHWQTDAPPVADKSVAVRRQAAVKTREASIQTSAFPVKETPKETGKTVRTRDGLIQSPATAADVRSDGIPLSKETKVESGGASNPLPKERTDYAANPKRRKPVGEQSRAVESKPNLKKEPPSGDIAKKAAGETKPSVAPVDESVKTKGAWLRQQGKDRPKERVTTETFKGKPQTKGQPPVKLAKGLSVPKTADSFPLALPPWEPSAPTGGGTATTRFVREKGGTAAGKVVRDLVPVGEKGLQIARPTAIKEAGTTGAKAVRTAERSAKTLRTAQTVSFRMSRQAAQTARSVQMRRAAVAAQQGAKAAAATLREAARKVVSTVKSAIAAAQSLVSALAAGGSTALVIVIVICLVAALIAAPFGLFLSGQTGVGENIQTAVSELTGEYNARIEQIKSETAWDELDVAPDIISAMQNNWKNVLAVYAVRVTTKDADATEVVTMTDEKKEILRETFFDMNRISYYTTSRTVYSGDDDDEGTTIVTLHISVTAKNAEEMADEYRFNARQRELLEEMLSPEYDELFESLLGGADAGGGASPVLDPEILDGITLLMPSDLSEQRRQVVLTGAQLLGRVHYFWGGKSRVLGWDSRWGTPTRVWAAGSPSTGTVRPFGLDCSGFVDWVFYNVSGGTYLIGHGGGASSQHSYCTPISWSEALPGDLAFYPGDRHVGIVVGHDTFGNVKIMHCASGSNNVVITGKIGFVSVGRPYYYQ